MEEIIEISIETPDGTADCRLELMEDNDVYYYNATILYPHIVNGYSRSEIHCMDVYRDGTDYYLKAGEGGIHPKLKKLEGQIAAAIQKANR
jgi:hypothetical protein